MFARLGLKPMAIELTPGQVEAQRMPRGCAKLEAAE
jgi:biotin synthase